VSGAAGGEGTEAARQVVKGDEVPSGVASKGLAYHHTGTS
jgi:hypothetical protein